MSEYEIKECYEHAGQCRIRQDGRTICHDVDKPKADLILSALQLLDSLTPPEGIEAAEETIRVKHCKAGNWYYWDVDAAWWFVCTGVPSCNRKVFMQIRRNKLYATWFVDSTCMHPPRSSLETTVGELKPGERAILNGLSGMEYKRLAGAPMHSGYQYLENGYFMVCSYDNDTPCTRVLDDKEK